MNTCPLNKQRYYCLYFISHRPRCIVEQSCFPNIPFLPAGAGCMVTQCWLPLECLSWFRPTQLYWVLSITKVELSVTYLHDSCGPPRSVTPTQNLPSGPPRLLIFKTSLNNKCKVDKFIVIFYVFSLEKQFVVIYLCCTLQAR